MLTKAQFIAAFWAYCDDVGSSAHFDDALWTWAAYSVGQLQDDDLYEAKEIEALALKLKL